MKFTVTSERPGSVRTGCVILGVYEHRTLSSAAAEFDKATNGLLKKVLKDGDMDGSSEQTVMVHYPAGAKCERVILVGCGKASEFNVRAYQQAACSAARAPLDERTGEDAGPLVSTRQIPGSFSIRQQLQYRYGEERGSFEAVVQKLCDEVVVIGFAPFGAPAFTIHQRGLEVRVESHLPGPWPFSPSNILLDVHRTFFLPIPETPPPDGSYATTFGGQRLRERWESGHLIERRIRRADEDGPGAIVITYVGGMRRGAPAREIRFENGIHGYRIDIAVVAYEPLACAE